MKAEKVEAKRDKNGMWFHPSFPWLDLPENVALSTKEWGHELSFHLMEHDASDEILERYANQNSPDCSYWNPTPPKGEGWFLGAIYDTEDGPAVCFMRPLPTA